MKSSTKDYYDRMLKDADVGHFTFHALRHPYVKHTTKIFSLRLMDFQAQAYPDARRKTRGACQLLRVGQSRSPVRPLCNRKRFSCLPPQSKMSWMDNIVNMLGLDDKLNNMPNQLSGGQQQRVAIARALISKPAIVLADEPTGNLDSKTSSEVLGLLKRTSEEFHQTIVMITHNNDIARLADRIVRIEDGKITGGMKL